MSIMCFSFIRRGHRRPGGRAATPLSLGLRSYSGPAAGVACSSLGAAVSGGGPGGSVAWVVVEDLGRPGPGAVVVEVVRGPSLHVVRARPGGGGAVGRR